MPTFKWRDTLTVTVSEMSRTRALECARQFDAMAAVYTDYTELLRETDVLAVVYAPVTVKTADGVLVAGEHTLALPDGETVKLTLPLTTAAFNALPMSLTEEWVSAAITANGWLIETLKKILIPAEPMRSEPKSVNAPSYEPTPIVPQTTTIGA